jgi:hypothetical protein
LQNSLKRAMDTLPTLLEVPNVEPKA